jgi:hypothetical protein
MRRYSSYHPARTAGHYPGRKHLMKKRILPVIALAFFVSCFGGFFYDFSLLDVQRPAQSSGKSGMVKIERVPDTASIKYRYSDTCFDMVVCFTVNQFEFTLKNKTAGSVVIDWEKCAFISPRGVRKRVVHRGINYAQKEVVQSPTLVYKGETVSDIMIPSGHITSYLYGSGGWTITPMFSAGDAGKNVKVIVALRINGVVNEYVFTMRVNAV